MSNTDTSYMRIVREVRIRATRLLKAARQGDIDAIKQLSGQLKRRRALDVAAHELSGVAYLDLVSRSGNATIADPVRFFDRQLSPHWNHWFAQYEETVAHLRLMGGFLFPFRSQFVVIDAHVLRSLDLDPDNPDWCKIGFNWAQPADIAAYARLNVALCKAGFSVEETNNAA